MTTISLILILIAAVIGWALGNMRSERQQLQDRIAKLEKAQLARLPYLVADEIENAEAALVRLKIEYGLYMNMVDNALAHLQKARACKK